MKQDVKVRLVEEWAVFLALLVILATLMSGCAGRTGWRVSFGVSPVTAISDQASLTQTQEAENGK